MTTALSPITAAAGLDETSSTAGPDDTGDQTTGMLGSSHRRGR